MIYGLEFKDGMAEVKVVSAEDSELKELPRFAQDLISTKFSSDGITKLFKCFEDVFNEGILGKYKVPMSHTLEKLYKEYDAAKAEYSEYRTLHNILLDIAEEPDISDTDIEILNEKIKICKMKRDAVGRAYKALIAFIESI